jgi:hypothetical protein
MGAFGLIRCLACSAFLFSLVCGCQAIDGHRTLLVQVRDGDTKQPINDAQARISYPLSEGIFAPGGSYAQSDRDGHVPLPASTFINTTPLLEVHADGYLPEHRFVSVETVRATKPLRWFEPLDGRAPAVVLDVYADKPLPTIELVAPLSFRGLVQVELQVPDSAADVPGQRQFSFPVPEEGTLVVTGPAILRRFPVPNFTARFADGTPIRREGSLTDYDIGLWSIKYDTRKFLFLIGSREHFAAYQALHPSSIPNVGPAPVDPSTRHGGGGHGRRGGTQQDVGPGGS